jgi:DNA-binding NtrC family response regulator
MLSVLIVEDSPVDALLVERHLARAGNEVYAERVENAAAMQEALSRREWDAIVSDYTIPGFGALAALRLPKQSRHDIPFIVLSGTIDEETAVAVMRSGAHDYILKDNLARLVPAIEREMQEVAARRLRRQTEAALRDMHRRRGRHYAPPHGRGRTFPTTSDADCKREAGGSRPHGRHAGA